MYRDVLQGGQRSDGLELRFFLPLFLSCSSVATNCQFPTCPLVLGSLLILLLGRRPRSVAFLEITRTCRGSGYCPHCGVAESEHGVSTYPQAMGWLGSHWSTGREASSDVQGRSSRRSKVGWLGATVLSSSLSSSLSFSFFLSLSPSFPLLLFRCYRLPVSFLPTRLEITPVTVVRSPAPLCCFLGITRPFRGSGYCPHCGVAESEHGVPDLPAMG
jgi:hypothetical protein